MQLLELYQLIVLINASHLLLIRITLFLVPISCWKEQTTSSSVENPSYSCLNFMIMAMMVMMICRTIISQTSNSSSSGSRWARTKTKTFLESNGQNLFRTVEKSWKIKPFGHSRAPKRIKNATFWPFSPSWGNWPICVLCIVYMHAPYMQNWAIDWKQDSFN